MSWSVSAHGKVSEIRSILAAQFAAAKGHTNNILHERDSVCQAESIVNGQLDFLAKANPEGNVQVNASGSAYFTNDGDGNIASGGSSFSMSVQPG